MRNILATVVILLLGWAQSPAQQPEAVGRAGTQIEVVSTQPLTPESDAPPHTKLSLNELVDRVVRVERREIETIESFKPIVETYMQIVKQDKLLGTAPDSDYYFLGEASFAGHPKLKSLLTHTKTETPLYRYHPSGFLDEIFVDPADFDRAHYDLSYAGQAFLGELRCYLFDVAPRAETKTTNGFHGRIWVEETGFAIVRINGSFSPGYRFALRTFQPQFLFHFDSWRTNAQPGLWLPSYIYSQELGRDRYLTGQRLKAQTRLWAYHKTREFREDEFTDLKVESLAPLADEEEAHDRSPLEALRLWRREAEDNALDALQAGGLLAPSGAVDKELNTVVNNLEVTNHLDSVDLHCRILLTSSFDMFSIGDTIVLSRGLIDVVPDEATLAVLLSEEIADAMVPKPYLDQFGFVNEVRFPTTEIMKRLSFEEEKRDRTQNRRRAVELIANSPYAANLEHADLFFEQLRLQSKHLKQLISPRLGNEVLSVARKWNGSAALDSHDKDQIAALPLGSRIKLNPWDDRAELAKTRATPVMTVRDKLPFEVVPLDPYVTKYVDRQETAASGASVLPAVP